MDKKTTEEALQKTGKGLKGVVGEFKEFISKGNVLDMAVGLIVGSAFTAIVNSLVDDILMPVIGTVLVGINFSSLGITIPWGNHPFIAIGSFLNTIITFLLTALCVFLIVKTMNIIPPQAGRKACTAEAQQGGAASHRNSRSAGSTAGKADSEGREKERLKTTSSYYSTYRKNAVPRAGIAFFRKSMMFY